MLNRFQRICWDEPCQQFNERSIEPNETQNLRFHRKINRKLDTYFNTQTHARSQQDYWLRIQFGDVQTVFDRPYVCLHMYSIASTHLSPTVYTPSGMWNTFRSNYYYASYPQCLDFNTKMTKRQRKTEKWIENHDWVLKPNRVNRFQISNKMKWNVLYAFVHTIQWICSITTTPKCYWIRHFVRKHE